MIDELNALVEHTKARAAEQEARWELEELEVRRELGGNMSNMKKA
jgi:hypothetical protein